MTFIFFSSFLLYKELGGEDEISDNAEYNARQNDYSDDDKVVLKMLIHLEENQKTDSGTREKSRHHRACGYQSARAKGCQGNRCRTVRNQTEDRRNEVTDDGLIIHYHRKSVLSDKEDDGIDEWDKMSIYYKNQRSTQQDSFTGNNEMNGFALTNPIQQEKKEICIPQPQAPSPFAEGESDNVAPYTLSPDPYTLFEEFWQAYPKKIGKGYAFECFKK